MSVAWVGVGVAALGTAYSTSQAKKASNAQVGAAHDANDTTLAMFDQSRADLTPYRTTGDRARDVLSQELGLGTQSALSYDDWLKQNTPAAPAPQATGGGLNSHGQHLLTASTGGLLKLGGLFGKKKKAPAPAVVAASEDAQHQADYAKYLQDFKDSHAAAPAGMEGDLVRDFTLADFQKDPGYQFRLDEGLKGVERSGGARAGILSGATEKALDRYNSDYASGEYSNAYNRFNNDRTQRFNRLSAIAGTGQTAATTTGTLGANAAGTIGENTLQAGNARAAGAVGEANAINSGITTLGNFYLQNKYGRVSPYKYGSGTGITADQGLNTSGNLAYA